MTKGLSSEVQHTRKNQFQQAMPRNFNAGGQEGINFDYAIGGYMPYEQQRDTTESQLGAQRTNVFSNQGNTKYFYDDARHTTRQTVNVLNYKGIAGSIPNNSKPASYMAGYNATTDGRQEVLLPSRLYGPNRTTGPSIGGCDIDITIKNRANYNMSLYGPNNSRIYNAIPGVQQSFTNTTYRGRREENNPYQPEDFLISQFERNPFTHSLTEAVKMTPN